MLVLGVDQSTTCTGWALYDTEKDVLLSFSKITPDKKKSYEFRIYQMVKEIKNIIKNTGVKYLKYEEAFSKSRNVKKQENIIGMLMYLCFEHGVAFEAIHPSKINKLWNIPYKKKDQIIPKKQATIKAVRFVFNVDISNNDDDIADAISFAYLKTESQEAYERNEL